MTTVRLALVKVMSMLLYYIEALFPSYRGGRSGGAVLGGVPVRRVRQAYGAFAGLLLI